MYDFKHEKIKEWSDFSITHLKDILDVLPQSTRKERRYKKDALNKLKNIIKIKLNIRTIKEKLKNKT